MGMRAKIYRSLLKDALSIFLVAVAAGSGVFMLINFTMGSGYILAGSAMYLFVNITLIVILVKGMIEREYSSFSAIRKDLFGINLIMDFSIAFIASGLATLAAAYGTYFKESNEALRLVDVEKLVGKANLLEYFGMTFFMLLFILSFLTLDFMRNNGALRSFLAGKDRKVRASIRAMVIYMILAVGLGLGSNASGEISSQFYRILLMAVLFVLTCIFYFIAGKAVKRKEFGVDY